MCPSSGLGQAIAATAGQDIVDGGVEIYFVSNGYVQHAGSVFGAEGGSDDFFSVVQVGI